MCHLDEINSVLRGIFQHFLILEDQQREDLIVGDLEGLLIKLELIGATALKPCVGAYEHSSATTVLTVEHLERV